MAPILLEKTCSHELITITKLLNIKDKDIKIYENSGMYYINSYLIFKKLNIKPKKFINNKKENKDYISVNKIIYVSKYGLLKSIVESPCVKTERIIDYIYETIHKLETNTVVSVLDIESREKKFIINDKKLKKSKQQDVIDELKKGIEILTVENDNLKKINDKIPTVHNASIINTKNTYKKYWVQKSTNPYMIKDNEYIYKWNILNENEINDYLNSKNTNLKLYKDTSDSYLIGELLYIEYDFVLMNKFICCDISYKTLNDILNIFDNCLSMEKFTRLLAVIK